MAPAIRVSGLRKTYSAKGQEVHALNGVDFEVARGEIFGLLGPNGAGKTTLIHILSGLALPTSGEASVMGSDVVRDARGARRALGLAGQEPDFDWFITVRDALLYHCGYHGIPRADAAPRVDALLKRFDLWEKRNARVVHLSGGMKRRLLIARAAAHDPDVVILDEPTAGVDVELRYKLWNFIRELHRGGRTVVITTHYIEEAENLCDRVGIIHRGRIVALDTPERLMAQGESDLVVLGLAEPLKARSALPPDVDSAFHSLSEDRRSLVLEGADGGRLAAHAVAELVRSGLAVESVSIERKRLEDVFVKLTGLRIDGAEEASP